MGDCVSTISDEQNCRLTVPLKVIYCVFLSSQTNSVGQVFQYEYATKAIVNFACSTYAVDVYAGGCANNVNVNLWSRHGKASQKFEFWTDGTIRRTYCSSTKVLHSSSAYIDLLLNEL